MVDIRELGINLAYTFTDGDKVILTKNPTTKFFKVLLSNKDNLSFEMVEGIWKFMLSDEDYAVYGNADIKVKIYIIREYIEYHVGRLNSKPFRSTSDSN